MASGNSIKALGIEEEELLKTYRLSSLKPSKWEDIDPAIGGDDGGGPSTSSALRSTKGEDDPLGLSKGPILTDVPGDLRASVSTNSKSFDPKVFLSTVHPNASFSDLKKGGARLRESLEQRSEALKILVESEFDRFVAVKVANEAVYEQMKAGPLRPESDYATADLKESLRLATSKADQVYMPILENRKKAERLRSTLGVFERSKFFFNLPGTLVEAIEAERYDTALLAYKRGRNMLDSRPGQVLNLPAPKDSEELAQQQRIFDKVWSEVEKVVNGFKAKLLEKLAGSNDRPTAIEEVEKTIEIILELDPMDDPAWIFCEYQHKWIMDKLSSVFKKAVSQTRAIIEESNLSSWSEENSTVDFRSCFVVIDSPTLVDVGVIAAQAVGSEVWFALQELVRVLSEFLSKEIVAYWKIVKGYLDGKYQRPDAKLRKDIKARRSISCKQMTNEIILCYTNLLSEFFLFSSDPNSPLARSPVTELPAFVPKHANSIQAAYYLRQLIDHLAEWSHEIGGLELPEESLTYLKELVGNGRFKFQSALAAYWVKDAKAFHKLEDWTRPERGEDENQPLGTTVYLKRIYDFHRYMMLNSFRLAGGNEQIGQQIFIGHHSTDQPPSKTKGNRQLLPMDCSRKAQSGFLDALYGYLDGLVHVAFTAPQPGPSTSEASESKIGLGLSSVLVHLENGGEENPGMQFQEDESDTRLLLTISNLAHLTSLYIPKLFRQFSDAFPLDLTKDLTTVMDVIGQLDTLLLGDYIKRKSEILSEIIQTGVLNGDIDWLTAPKPTEVHSFIYDALLSLVLVHAQVTSVAGPVPSTQNSSEPLVKTILSTLIEELANECLKAFGSVQKFGLGGMLQATLEIEFMHRTLSAYVTPQADLIMQSIYQKISNAYQRIPANGDSEGATNELQKELETLKRTLHFSRRTTALAFVCFKKPKTSSHSPHDDPFSQTSPAQN